MQLQSQTYRVITGLLVLISIFVYNIRWILRDEFLLVHDDTKHHNSRDAANDTQSSQKDEIILFDACGRQYHPILSTTTVPMSESSNIEFDDSDVDDKRNFCSREHALAVQQCSPPGSNTVLHFRKEIQETVPFSVQQVKAEQLQRLPSSSSSSLEYTSTSPLRLLPKCQTLSDFLDSIKYGTRVWDQNVSPEDMYNLSDSTQLEKRPSRFVPSKCHVPVFPPSPDEICNIMNRFSHVYMDGDSLSRHLRQTLIMVIRGGEWSKGAIMTNNSETNDLCSCDGQYSENYKCRQFDDYFKSPMISPVDIPRWNRNNNSSSNTYTGLCNNLMNARTIENLSDARKSIFQLGYSETLRRKSDIPWDQIQCESESYRGLFLTVQGGLHFQNNATITFLTKVYPIMSNPTYLKCLELNKVQLVWIGATAQSRLLDSEYNHQSREYAIEFNQEMKSLILNSGLPGSEKIIFMDWWNMTADSQSSDGLHSLMDINLAKVSQLLYLMDLLWNNNTKGEGY